MNTVSTPAPKETRMQRINIGEKFGEVFEHWRPKIVAEINGQEMKLVKIQGVFPWHVHEDADEMFLVWRGRISVEFRRRTVDLHEGEFLVVPRGTLHRPVAQAEAEIILFECAAVRNTGDVLDERFTAPNDARI